MINYLHYLGVSHDYQKYNCLSIIAEFYETELNISLAEERLLFNNFCFKDLKEIRRIPVENIYQLKNWIKVSLEEIKEYDIIVYVKNSKLSHFTMYMGQNKVLSLCENQKSGLRHLDDQQRSYISGVIRHRSLAT